MMALKVIGLSHRPQIIVSRPASMRLAMAISPSRERSSTAPISRRYMRTGSSVRSVGSFLVAAAGRGPPSSSGSTSSSAAGSGSLSSSSSSSPRSSLSTTCTPISLSADITSSIWSPDISPGGSASLSSSSVMTPRFLARAISFLIDASLRSSSGESPVSAVSISCCSFFAISSRRLICAGQLRQPVSQVLLRLLQPLLFLIGLGGRIRLQPLRRMLQGRLHFLPPRR